MVKKYNRVKILGLTHYKIGLQGEECNEDKPKAAV